jgi:hypothetical protein
VSTQGANEKGLALPLELDVAAQCREGAQGSAQSTHSAGTVAVPHFLTTHWCPSHVIFLVAVDTSVMALVSIATAVALLHDTADGTVAPASSEAVI